MRRFLVPLILCSLCTPSLAEDPRPPRRPRLGLWNGKPARPGEHAETFFITLSSTRRTPDPEEICTGVLIHPRLILTAAHCLKDHSVDRVGNSNRAGPSELSDVEASIKRSMAHPLYRQRHVRTMREVAENARYDIGFLILKESVAGVFIPELRPALPPEDLLGKQVRIVGYGASVLSRGSRIPRENGRKLTGSSRIDQTLPGLLFMKHSSQGALPGDSGGPVYVETPDGPFLAGLIHSYLKNEGGDYLGFTAHLLSKESLCWVEGQSGLNLNLPFPCQSERETP